MKDFSLPPGSAGTATKPLVTSTRLDAPGGVMRPRITVLGGGVIGLATAVVATLPPPPLPPPSSHGVRPFPELIRQERRACLIPVNIHTLIFCFYVASQCFFGCAVSI